jgi:hypothetical protein
MGLIAMTSGVRRHARGAVGTFALAALLGLPASAGAAVQATPAPATAAATTTQPVPSRATVLEVQLLFRELGYPLGSLPLGGLGPRTRGAISYFQRKYNLPVSGYPDPATLAAMKAVAASLHGRIAPQSAPHDIVERTIGDQLPVLTIAVLLAGVLTLLAVSPRRGAAQDSTAAEGTLPVGSAES